MTVEAPHQLGLFAISPQIRPASLQEVPRLELSATSWVDHQPGWLQGSDKLYDELAERAHWQQGRRWMYHRMVDEPRLTSWYRRDAPLPHDSLEPLFEAFSQHYGPTFDSVGLNWYRHGEDSVAWHGDRVGRSQREAIVVIVSLGLGRPFLLRPSGGGRSRRYVLGGGDLLVMGGDCQREFQHTVPKVANAGPRMSVTFRHGAQRPDKLTTDVDVVKGAMQR
jgi:alkylated DNA repair dioxygenase AlkB